VRECIGGKAIDIIFVLRRGIHDITGSDLNIGSVLYLSLEAGVRVYVKNLFSLFLAPPTGFPQL